MRKSGSEGRSGAEYGGSPSPSEEEAGGAGLLSPTHLSYGTLTVQLTVHPPMTEAVAPLEKQDTANPTMLIERRCCFMTYDDGTV